MMAAVFVFADHRGASDGEEPARTDVARGAEVIRLTRPADGLVCTRCGTCCEWGSVMACTMWPKGCKTGPSDPPPLVCWRCCDEDEQCDLVDAGCPTALAYRRGW